VADGLRRPMRADEAEALLASTEEPFSRRLTGTHQRFTLDDGTWRGELAVNGWDPDNRSCGIRIGLEPHARGRGIGPEAMRAVIDHPIRCHVHASSQAPSLLDQPARHRCVRASRIRPRGRET
jgi:GNAT superfamily N-acetyltransferase